ncbi:MAG: redoxin family protein [Methylophagaceae bacterium]|jgi:peroxiredoxin|tara:strand:- start:1095 stop:1577 length:483 start_codon:yes stop_codon:yes gene_type:complete
MNLPDVTFKCRVAGEWIDKTTNDFFKGKRIVLFALPGAFTPTCSSKQLPKYEEMYDQFINKGVTDVYCLSVNDGFVMNAWADDQNIEKVKFIPDGSGEFTRRMGMLVNKENLGFGYRSWRYAMIVNDGVVERVYEEAGKGDNTSTDPFEVSKAENVLSGC